MQQSVNTRPNILIRLEETSNDSLFRQQSEKVVFNPFTYLPHDSVHEGSSEDKNKH